MKLPRRKALVVSGFAGATTLLIGSLALAMSVQGGLGMVLSGSDANEATVVTEVQYDDTLVVVPDAPAPNESGGVAPAPAPTYTSSDQGEAWAPAPVAAPAASSGSQAAGPASSPERESEAKAAPAPTTPTPTTAPRPAPEPEEDAPPASGTPPKPAGCVGGVLEDNGVWNCQH